MLDIPNVTPPMWGILPEIVIEQVDYVPPTYQEPCIDLTEECVPDSRAFFNAVEKLLMNGLGGTARALAELGRDPIIKSRLIQLADEGGYLGGLRCAESAAEQTYYEIIAQLQRMG